MTVRALGCMRLSTAPDRDDGRGLEVLVAAIDAGVTLLDTADAYGWDEHDVGHNERLVAAARAARPSAPVRVATKGGMVRPGGRWQPDGRASHLGAAIAASRARLGAIDLYLLHAVDRAVPLATSVRALARAHADGLVAEIGLCNVNRAHIEAALAIAPITVVQLEVSPRRVAAIASGLVAWCRERGLTVLAHRPLGGPAGLARLGRDRAIAAVAARVGRSPPAVALAWLRAHDVVPLPGATQLATARDAAASLELDAQAIGELDAQLLGRVGAPGIVVPARPDAEVVVVMGLPGAGKSTAVAPLVEAGFVRLNRDDRGGTLAGIARALDAALAEGAARVVVDNTYPSRAKRAEVIAVARRHGVPVRCVWIDTSLDDAQTNAATRAWARLGRLPEPSDLRGRDPALVPPAAQFLWQREFEPPAADEGFITIERRSFVRSAAAGAPALIIDVAGGLWPTRPSRGDDEALRDDVIAHLGAARALGWTVVATGWAPDLDDAAVATLTARVAGRAGWALPIAWCRHPAGPPRCWCRKPLPGLGVALAHTHGLALARSIQLGTGAVDRGFAARLGLTHVDLAAWLAAAVVAPSHSAPSPDAT